MADHIKIPDTSNISVLFRQDIRTFAVKETTATCSGFVEKYTLKNLNYIICHKQIE
jgi:hypothetical protein